MKGQGGGWRRKNNRDNAHTAIASCPFTGKDVRRTERGRSKWRKQLIVHLNDFYYLRSKCFIIFRAFWAWYFVSVWSYENGYAHSQRPSITKLSFSYWESEYAKDKILFKIASCGRKKGWRITPFRRMDKSFSPSSYGLICFPFAAWFFTTAGSYFVLVFCLSEVAPAGWGSFSGEASKKACQRKGGLASAGICHKQSPKWRHKESILISFLER